MLTFLRPRGDLRRLAPGRWLATGDDPRFDLVRLPGGPRHAVIELTAEDEPIDAAVYPRAAGRLSEARRIDLPAVRRLLLVINLAEGVAAEGARIDPADVAGARFGLRLWTRRTVAGLDRLVRRRLAGAPGLRPEMIGPDPGLGRAGLRPRLLGIGRRGLAHDLERIWESAGLAAALDPLPAPETPVVSLLCPVYDADPAHLDHLLASVRDQAVGAELILSDDGSTRPETRAWLDAAAEGRADARPPLLTVLRAGVNRGVAAATNAALAVARGDWVGLIDHDDALAPHAVDRLRRAIAAAPDAAFIYTDEVVADAAMQPISAFLKPAFDPVLLSGVNYVNHLSLYRRDRLVAMGGLRDGFQGSQDYELVLRYCRGLPAERIAHLPYPAYVWRQHAASLSHAKRDAAVAAARRALEAHFGAVVGRAVAGPALIEDLHRLRFPDAPRPAISAVIPNRDSFPLIERALRGLLAETAYPGPLETIVVDNGSVDPRVPALYADWADRAGLRWEIRPEPFNYAAMVNRGVAMARGEAFLLLNNDVAMLEPHWLDEMASCLAYPGVGIVGARLLYPDGALQHAGVILGLGGLAGHWFYKAPASERGPMGRLAVRNGMGSRHRTGRNIRSHERILARRQNDPTPLFVGSQVCRLRMAPGTAPNRS